MDLSSSLLVLVASGTVSLREEGVDLSCLCEIPDVVLDVSLREEGVDLSLRKWLRLRLCGRLPPRGGSGFKH